MSAPAVRSHWIWGNLDYDAAAAGICARTEEQNACGRAELQSVWGCPRVLQVQEIGAALGIGATAVDMRAPCSREAPPAAPRTRS